MSSEEVGDPAFYSRIQRIVHEGNINIGIALGMEHDLFEAIIKFQKPFSAQELADATESRVTHIRLWLLLMAAGGIIDLADEKGHLFSLPVERHAALTSPYSAAVHSSLTVAQFASCGRDLSRTFKLDGPEEIDNFSRMMEIWHKGRKRCFYATIPQVVDQIPGLRDTLTKGARILDVGCGRGDLCYVLKDLFPKCTITGIDQDKTSIEVAWESVQMAGAKVDFQVLDIMNSPEEWTNQFDYVVSVHAMHHFDDAKAAVSHIKRVLKPDGWFSALEFKIDADVSKMLKFSGALSYLSFQLMLLCAPSHHGTPPHDDDINEEKEGDEKVTCHSQCGGDKHPAEGGKHLGGGDEHPAGGHHHHRGGGHKHAPKDFQTMASVMVDGGFSSVKIESIPRANFLEELHLFAQKK